jgi:hypothetical protein
MTLSTCSAAYLVKHDSSTGLVSFSKTLKPFAPGTYAYKWTVTDETGNKFSLGGISEALNKRLSQYISTFNNNASYELSSFVTNPKNKTRVQIFGPFGKDIDPKTLEQELIASIPEEQSLNRTSGGNGGGAWSQFDDPTPTVTTHAPKDTPEKKYAFKRNSDDIISPVLSPGAKKIKSAVFVIEHVTTGAMYVGQSSNVTAQISHIASLATHMSPSKTTGSKIVRALHQSPNSHVVGLLPTTKNLSPRSLRAAAIFHIEKRKPTYNGNKGGGGPAPLRKQPLGAKNLFA